VNRASLGVQDCDTTVLAAVNRMQTIETTREAVAMLRAAGVSRLNIDLMYGLPHQTVEGVCKTIDAVHELRPDRLAVFGYAHLPSFKPQQALIDEAALPGPEERYAQYEAGRARLQAHGYEAIGLDHFAWPDDQIAAAHRAKRLARNFQGYTTDESPVLIGFGSSAISAFPGGYTQNAVGMPEYRKAIMSGNFATARGVELTADDRLRRDAISDLMCYGTCNLAQTAIRHGVSPGIFDDDFPAIDALAEDGLVERKGYQLRIPDGAHAGVRVVCARSTATCQRHRRATPRQSENRQASASASCRPYFGLDRSDHGAQAPLEYAFGISLDLAPDGDGVCRQRKELGVRRQKGGAILHGDRNKERARPVDE
jgi:oxygen-independent coproporphyrinogen-3 oxidase